MDEDDDSPQTVIDVVLTKDGLARAMSVPRGAPYGFQPGNAGGPLGPRKATVEARKAASELIDNPAYREALAERLLAGTAGAMEALMWFYAKGKPREQSTDDTSADAFKGVSDAALRERLVEAMKQF